MTPDQDNNEVLLTTWPSHPTDAIISPTSTGGVQKYFTLKCHTTSNTLMGKKLDIQQHHQASYHQHNSQQHQQHQQYKELKSEDTVEHTS